MLVSLMIIDEFTALKAALFVFETIFSMTHSVKIMLELISVMKRQF